MLVVFCATAWLFLLCLVVAPVISADVVIIPLSSRDGVGGIDWVLTNPGNASALSTVGGRVDGCRFPGNVYSHLEAAGVINDPLYRFNDVHYAWVARQRWRYEATFPLASVARGLCRSSINMGRVELVMSGVRVWTNITMSNSSPNAASQSEVVVGHTASQFLEYAFNVTSLMVELDDWLSSNVSIVLDFESTVNEAARLNASYSLQPLPVEPQYVGGLRGRSFARTEQSSFGWDWGPALAPIGVDGAVVLKVWTMDDHESVRLDVQTVWPQTLCAHNSHASNNTVTFNITRVIRAIGRLCNSEDQTPHACVRRLSMEVSSSTLSFDGNENVTLNVEFREVDVGVFEAVASSLVIVQNPALWYPRGYGSQPLHPLRGTVTLLSGTSSNTGSRSSWSLPPIAIRCIALKTSGNPQGHVPHPDTTFAPPNVAHPQFDTIHTMYFTVNGVAVFAKGSNVIPPSPLPDAVRDKLRLHRDLESALDANMNMIRLWGGGYYFDDWVYEFCDAHGILVWQEFVFACTEYPVDRTFLGLVEKEISQQVSRLARFGCIVLWSANNENEVYDVGASSMPYEVLYTTTVMHTLVQYDVSRPLWPSSPSFGFASGVDANGLPDGTPLLRDKKPPPQGHPPNGDTHYYNYFRCPDVDAYPKTHFASEFGFQSLPWLENLLPVSEPGDWSMNSSFTNHRQRHQNGNDEMVQLLLHNFFGGSTNVSLVSTLPFSRVIFLSQLQQAACVGDQIMFYRRGRDFPEVRTMGALYWQLNQIWQAPSWTSLEYGGEWKALHYVARSAFQTTQVSSFVREGSVYLHLANDGALSITNVTVHVFAVNVFDGSSVLLTPTLPVKSIPPRAGVFIWRGAADALPSTCRGASCVLWAEVGTTTTRWEHLMLLARRNLSIIHPRAGTQVEVNVISVAFNEAKIRVSLKSGLPQPALFVHLRIPAHPLGKFSHNLFHLIPCQTFAAHCPGVASQIVEFTNPPGFPLGDAVGVAQSIVVESL